MQFLQQIQIRPSGRLQRELDTQDRPKQIRLVAVALQPSKEVVRVRVAATNQVLLGTC